MPLLSPSQLVTLLINFPEKDTKAVHTILKSKFKMFTVTHPTYGNHKNKLKQWWQSGDFKYTENVFYFTATILFLFVKLSTPILKDRRDKIGGVGTKWRRGRQWPHDGRLKTCFHIGSALLSSSFSFPFCNTVVLVAWPLALWSPDSPL